jgi:hypothetical protein
MVLRDLAEVLRDLAEDLRDLAEDLRDMKIIYHFSIYIPHIAIA